MTSTPLSDIFLVIFVLVDDWYQANVKFNRAGRPGRKPLLTEHEVMTILIAMDDLPFSSERQWLAYLRAHHADLFPHSLDQSQFNRRARRLDGLVERFCRACLVELGLQFVEMGIIDTSPLPVMGNLCQKLRSDFVGSAAYGYYASKKMHYFGYKLVIVTILTGIPLVYDLVPANPDERRAAEALLEWLNRIDLLADKGFIGEDWQRQITRSTGNRFWTAKRKNQPLQPSAHFERRLNKWRLRIEGVFNQFQNVGRNIERLFAKTVNGLCTRIAAKFTSHLVKFLLRSLFWD